MKQLNPTSIGNPITYQPIHELTAGHPNLYRKCYNIITTIRTIKNNRFSMWPDSWAEKEAERYAIRAFQDYRLPDRLKKRLRWAILEEFNFDIDMA